jgi:hypothetical protein
VIPDQLSGGLYVSAFGKNMSVDWSGKIKLIPLTALCPDFPRTISFGKVIINSPYKS